MEKKLVFILALFTLSAPILAQRSLVELGWQTTSRGIVWFANNPPVHNPYWQFSRDTNKVMWVDTLTSLRYDWSYKDNVWYTKGRAGGAVPPLARKANGSTMLDNRTAFWIRDTFNLLHKYDSTAQAWVPFGDFMYLSTVPTDIAATATNGAAKYRRSLWQDADDNVLYYFDGSAWVEVGGDLSVTNELQTISASGAGPTQYNIDLDLGGGSVTLAEGANIDLTRTSNTITIAAASGSGTDLTFSGASSPVTLNSSTGTDVTITAGGINTLSATSGNVTITGTEAQALSASGAGPTQYNIDLTPSSGSVTLAEGAGINLTRSTNTITVASTITQADGSETIVNAGTGIGVSGTGTSGSPYVVSNTGDLSATNEGSLTVGAGTGSTSLINSNTSGSTAVTLTAGTGMSISETGNNITLASTITQADGSETKINPGTGIGVSGVGTVGNPYVISNTGDLSATNEGSLTVNAGSGTTSIISSNTSGSTDVTLTTGTGLSISEVGNVITVTNTGDLSTTNELQTISASGTAPNFSIDLSASGGSVGVIQGSNMTITRTGNNITFAASGGGTLTTAENGLHVIGTAVRLGGTLLDAATSINGNAKELRYYNGKFSVSSWTGFANTPTQPVRFQGQQFMPTVNATPTLDGIVEYTCHSNTGSDQANSMTIGAYTTVSDGIWMQARSSQVPNFEYPLSLQPRGGQMSVGRTGSLQALVTFAGLGLTGTTAAGSVLHLQHSEGHGNVPLTFGAGTDIVDAEVMWRDVDDAFRIINRNAIDNTSSIRFAIAGQTNDLMTLVKSSNATSLVKLGVGVGNPANVHSTIQSAGGYAGRVLTTVGSFTLDESNWVVIYTAGSTVTWTLPTASTCTGREYILCSRSTGTVNLSASVSKGNGGTFNSLSAGQWAVIWSDGSGWTGYKLASL